MNVFYYKENLTLVFYSKFCGIILKNVIKRRLQHSCFPVNIAKLLRIPILKNIWEQLLVFVNDYDYRTS